MNALVAAYAVLVSLPLTLALQDPAPAKPDAKPDTNVGALVPGKMDAALLKKMEWLCGTWVLEAGGKTTEEHWRPLQGTTILGSSHSFDAQKTHFIEHLRIELRRGTIAYVAMPGGSAPTVFPLVQVDDRVVVFENGKHDHPQRIRYEKTDQGVTATISLLDGSKAASFVFTKKG